MRRWRLSSPPSPPDLRVLANYRQVPASLVLWSGPTAPGGIEAEVVELGRPHRGQLDRLDVAGKMVLVDPPADLSRRGALKAELYRRGASGMISYATAHPHLPDEYYWLNAWGDHGWAFTKSSSPLVGFSITPSQGALCAGVTRRWGEGPGPSGRGEPPLFGILSLCDRSHSG
jgi:hypothetical protein